MMPVIEIIGLHNISSS